MRLRFLPYTVVALASLGLMSCSHLPSFFRHPVHAHHHHTAEAAAKPRFPGGEYVRCLTLAQLAAQSNAADAKCLRTLDAYTAGAPVDPAAQLVVAFDYKDRKSSRPQTLLAPVPDDKRAWGDLQQIMNRIAAAPYTLTDLHLLQVTVEPEEPLSLADADTDTRRQTLDGLQQDLLDNAEAPPPLDEARQQLRLIDFFIDHRFRDAAYLSVDNAKRLLAAASGQQPQDAADIKALSRQLDAAEARLHKALPYTLSVPHLRR